MPTEEAATKPKQNGWRALLRARRRREKREKRLAKKGKKNIFSGRVIEIDSGANYKQVFETTGRVSRRRRALTSSSHPV